MRLKKNYSTGILIMNFAQPIFSERLAVISPLCISTIFLHRYNPIPSPTEPVPPVVYLSKSDSISIPMKPRPLSSMITCKNHFSVNASTMITEFFLSRNLIAFPRILAITC